MIKENNYFLYLLAFSLIVYSPIYEVESKNIASISNLFRWSCTSLIIIYFFNKNKFEFSKIYFSKFFILIILILIYSILIYLFKNDYNDINIRRLLKFIFSMLILCVLYFYFLNTVNIYILNKNLVNKIIEKIVYFALLIGCFTFADLIPSKYCVLGYCLNFFSIGDRFQLFSNNPNINSYIFSIILIIYSQNIITEKNINLKNIFVLIAIFLIIILTKSRICILLSFLYLFYIVTVITKYRILCVLFLLFLTSILILNTNIMFELRFFDNIDRLNIAYEFLKFFIYNMPESIFGYGLDYHINKFGYVENNEIKSAHNFYIDLIMTAGIFGFFLLSYIFLLCYNIIKNNKIPKIIKLIIYFNLIIFFTTGSLFSDDQIIGFFIFTILIAINYDYRNINCYAIQKF